jgi:RNA polymerase sigma-70 factor, ECF subfamily
VRFHALGRPGNTSQMPEQPPPSAVQSLFEQHATRLAQHLRQLGVPDADIADGVQEVFLIVDRRYGEFENCANVITWLNRISSYVAMGHMRRLRARREKLASRLPDPGVEADQHMRIERTEQRMRLQRLLDGLDEGQRAVVVLYELHGLPMRLVAEAVGCPIQTAYSRRNAALDRLRKGMLGDAPRALPV